MPALIAAPWLGTAIAGVATGAGMFGAAKVGANATDKAGAAQLQGSREAEQFARQQAQAQWQDAERGRRGDYDIWAARQHALNNYRQQYGYGQTRVPDYVPSADPGFMGSQGPRVAQPDAPAGVLAPRPMPQRQPTGAIGDYLSPQLRQTMRPPRQAMRRPSGDIGSYLRGGR